MNISDIIKNEMNKSDGRVKVVKVPADRKPTAESLRKLEREISAQISANEAMRNRSMQNASRLSGK